MNSKDIIEIPKEQFEPVRQCVDIRVGNFVTCNNIVFRIVQILDFESIIGIDVETGRSVPLMIGQLHPLPLNEPVLQTASIDLEAISDQDWMMANRRLDAIKPLISMMTFSRAEVEKRAQEINVGSATLYRWIKQYRAYRCLSSLIPRKRGWTEGKHRIPLFADKVICEVIEDFYLTPQRPKIQKAVMEVLRRCRQQGIAPPSPSTIRARIASIPEKIQLRGRGFADKARHKFLPAPGTFPNADFPLSVVQIDHTSVDIILVDDVYRKPIGRPWITLAIDVYSRMVTGYYLSFDAPSETSVAICVSHAILPKDEWMVLHKVDSKWPVWGVPKTIHVDNAGEFRSYNFQRSCLMYNIHLEFRPVKRPHYGGHIERLLGTLLNEIHGLSGTTFSSVKDREGYDAEKYATMTKSEFETWFVTLICKVYHQRMHSTLGRSPNRMWDLGVFGNNENDGIGMPPRPTDRQTIFLDFLPLYYRTVQTFGVTIDDVSYYSEALRPWINMKDKETGKKTQLIFRRDPRDISHLFFFDPDIKQYFKVPFADQSLPSMSIWEYRQAKRKLKQEGATVNNYQILDALTELRLLEEKSQETTKKARRRVQRRKEHQKKITPAAPLPPEQVKPVLVSTSDLSDLIDGDFDSFGEIL